MQIFLNWSTITNHHQSTSCLYRSGYPLNLLMDGNDPCRSWKRSIPCELQNSWHMDVHPVKYGRSMYDIIGVWIRPRSEKHLTGQLDPSKWGICRNLFKQKQPKVLGFIQRDFVSSLDILRLSWTSNWNAVSIPFWLLEWNCAYPPAKESNLAWQKRS